MRRSKDSRFPVMSAIHRLKRLAFIEPAGQTVCDGHHKSNIAKPPAGSEDHHWLQAGSVIKEPAYRRKCRQYFRSTHEEQCDREPMPSQPSRSKPRPVISGVRFCTSQDDAVDRNQRDKNTKRFVEFRQICFEGGNRHEACDNGDVNGDRTRSGTTLRSSEIEVRQNKHDCRCNSHTDAVSCRCRDGQCRASTKHQNKAGSL